MPRRAAVAADNGGRRRMSSPRRAKPGAWLFAVVPLAIASAAVLDPDKFPFFPRCLVKTWTGLDCPGCGTARAIHAAAHGHFPDALRCNPFLAVAIPFLAAIAAKAAWSKRRDVTGGAILAAVGWMVFRNVFL